MKTEEKPIKEYEILNKILCENCGINCDLVEVRIIARENMANFVNRSWLCMPCLEKETEVDCENKCSN